MHWQYIYLSISNPPLLTVLCTLSRWVCVRVSVCAVRTLSPVDHLYAQSKHAQQYALLMHMIRFVRLNAYMNYEFFV